MESTETETMQVERTEAVADARIEVLSKTNKTKQLKRISVPTPTRTNKQKKSYFEISERGDYQERIGW